MLGKSERDYIQLVLFSFQTLPRSALDRVESFLLLAVFPGIQILHMSSAWLRQILQEQSFQTIGVWPLDTILHVIMANLDGSCHMPQLNKACLPSLPT